MKSSCLFASSSPVLVNSSACSANNLYICKNYHRKRGNFTALARIAKRTTQRIPSDVPRSGKSHVSNINIDIDDVSLDRVSRDLDQLLSALSAAGFSHIGTPTPLELNPPHSKALPLRIRASVRSLQPLRIGYNNNNNSNSATTTSNVAPWKSSHGASGAFLVSVRGVSDTRTSGLLFGSKIRSLEVAYQAPLASVRARILSILSKHKKTGSVLRELREFLPPVRERTNYAIAESPASADTYTNTDTVRRVVPSGDIRDFFRPSCSIEPTYRDVIIIYCPKKKVSPRKKIADALQKAINPITNPAAAAADGTRGISVDDLFVEIYRDVPWGLLHHLFPSETQVVQPRARDLLRVDSLTLLGLVSTIVTYFRDADSPFVNIALAGTVAAYGFRIALGLQSAFSNYRARIIQHKFQFIVRKGKVKEVLPLIKNEAENGSKVSA